MPRPSPETKSTAILATYVSSSGFTNSVVRNYVGSTRSWSGQNSPQYYTYSSVPHGLPNNNHVSKITTRTVNLVRRYRYNVPPASPGWEDYSDTPDIILGTFPDHSYDLSHSFQGYEKALNDVISKVKGMTVNLAQAYAEVQKTMDLVGDTAAAIAKSIRYAKQGKFRQAARAVGAGDSPPGLSTANKWLALQYGWTPLLNDVKGAAEHLARRANPPILSFRARSRVSDSALVYLHDSGVGGLMTSRELGYSCDTEVCLKFSLGSQTARELSQLGITDPLLLVWELIPYSFVADWFFPVGRYLQGIGYDNGLSFRAGYVTQFSKNGWVVEIAGKNSNFSSTVKQEIGQRIIISSQNIYLTRNRLLAAPSVPVPRFKNPLSPAHMLNGLALLRKSCR